MSDESSASEKDTKQEEKKSKNKKEEDSEDEEEEDVEVHTSDMSSEDDDEDDEDDGKDAKPVLRKTGGPASKGAKKDDEKDDENDGKAEFLNFKLKGAGNASKPFNDPANNKGPANSGSNQPEWALKRNNAAGASNPATPKGGETNSQPAWAVKLKKTEGGVPLATPNENQPTTPKAATPTANSNNNNQPNAGGEAEIPEWRKKLLAQKRGDAPPAEKAKTWQTTQQQQQAQQQNQQNQQPMNRRPVSMGPGQLAAMGVTGSSSNFSGGASQQHGGVDFGPRTGQGFRQQQNQGQQQPGQQGQQAAPAAAAPVVEEKKEERFTAMDAKNAWKTKRELEVLKLKVEQERVLRQKAQKSLRESTEKVGELLDIIKTMAEALEETQAQLNEVGRDTQAKIEEIEAALVIEWRDAFFDMETKVEKEAKNREKDREKYGENKKEASSSSIERPKKEAKERKRGTKEGKESSKDKSPSSGKAATLRPKKSKSKSKSGN
eukprot:TRINITY_DN3591_c0_g1_i1.p1 TRINITY_DN3591_c0_g1~~TRINITY_DN3591_c0_g1_i1.p1  ORF type:complete len:492 (-),score=241.88 TRINITY_DN3591_c0_g1_i1:242-1717(-)